MINNEIIRYNEILARLWSKDLYPYNQIAIDKLIAVEYK